MATTPLKFRCPGCSQLLGVNPSKAGREIRCPRCDAAMIVPGPEEKKPESEARENFGPLLTPSSGEFRNLAGSDADFFSLPSPDPPNRPLAQGASVEGVEGAEEWTGVTSIVFETPSLSSPEPARQTRAGDVMVPRFLLTGGCLLALLAVAGAFGSGLLIGRYVWTTPPASRAR